MVAEAPSGGVTYVGPSQTLNIEGTIVRPGDPVNASEETLQALRTHGHEFEGDGITTSGLPPNPDASKEYLHARHDVLHGGGSVTIEPPDAQGPPDAAAPPEVAPAKPKSKADA